jgi:TatD DNase family protein
MKLVDTHAHLSDLEDREGVIRRAKDVGIEAIVAVGGNLQTTMATLDWADEYWGYVHPAIGIHPTEWMDNDIDKTLSFIDAHVDRCVAVGEIGLDYWNARTSEDVKETQREIYIRQLEIAVEHRKPVSVHGRGAWEDVLGLARKHGPDWIIFHWFSGPLEVLREVLDSGYLISATPAAEFSRDHRAALVEAPIESIVIETDSPVSYHGKQAEPADILLTLRSLADLKRISEKEVAEVTTLNAKRFFRL